jgi:hypothetical protein
MPNMSKDRVARLRSPGCVRFKTAGRVFASLDCDIGVVSADDVSVEPAALGVSSNNSASRRRSACHFSSEGVEVIDSVRRNWSFRGASFATWIVLLHHYGRSVEAGLQCKSHPVSRPGVPTQLWFSDAQADLIQTVEGFTMNGHCLRTHSIPLEPPRRGIASHQNPQSPPFSPACSIPVLGSEKHNYRNQQSERRRIIAQDENRLKGPQLVKGARLAQLLNTMCARHSAHVSARAGRRR